MANESKERGGFYATIPAPVLDDPSLRYASMVLYAKIVNYARGNGFCYAKNEELMHAMERVDPVTGAVTGVTERTLQGWLAELKTAGHIQIDTGPLPSSSEGKVVTGRRIFIGGFLTRKETTQGGEKICGGENNFAEGVKKISPPIKGINNINKHNPLPPKGGRETVDPIEKELREYAGENRDLLDALRGFLEQRAKRKKGIKTSRQLHILLNKLDRLSEGDTAAKICLLDEATEHGWDSVYARQGNAKAKNERSEEVPKAKRYIRTDIVNGREVDVYE